MLSFVCYSVFFFGHISAMNYLDPPRPEHTECKAIICLLTPEQNLLTNTLRASSSRFWIKFARFICRKTALCEKFVTPEVQENFITTKISANHFGLSCKNKPKIYRVFFSSCKSHKEFKWYVNSKKCFLPACKISSNFTMIEM